MAERISKLGDDLFQASMLPFALLYGLGVKHRLVRLTLPLWILPWFAVVLVVGLGMLTIWVIASGLEWAWNG